jgi:NAD(P)-dependent dehydrogenase (short-subunit alcohol dehydrogenase family)
LSRAAAPVTNDPQNALVALVTGASSGIGLACASRLASRGYRVYGTTRRELASTAFPFAMLRLDVTDKDSVQRGIQSIVSREDRLDIVVNNAGFGLAGPVEFTSDEEARRQFDVNFFGVLRVCRAALPIMRRQRSGCIVNIGSIGGLIAIPYQPIYSASKFALEGFTEALRYEARAFGIRVVLIEPGDHRTEFTRNRQISGRLPDEAYRASFRAALSRMESDEQNGAGPEKIAALVERVVRLRHPRLRYTAGPASQRVAVWLKRVLPHSLFEFGMRRYYGLTGRDE